MKDKKFYISGPMAGIEKFNYPAFHAAERELRCLTGCIVLNPAAHAELEMRLDYEEFMIMSMAMIEICDCVLLLKGWEASPGALREVERAKELNKKIITSFLGLWNL